VVAGKQPNRVRARSVLTFWAVRDLGLSKSVVSRAVTRGQAFVAYGAMLLGEWKRAKTTPSPFSPLPIQAPELFALLNFIKCL